MAGTCSDKAGRAVLGTDFSLSCLGLSMLAAGADRNCHVESEDIHAEDQRDYEA